MKKFSFRDNLLVFIIACVFLFLSNSLLALSRSACNTPGTYDSFLLALNWTPGFCQNHETRKECNKIREHDSALDYAGKTLTLHGLWPQKISCGHHYGDCSGNHGNKSDFCSLPAPGIDKQVFSELEKVMPSAYAGSCLQRHEWYKHGTCALPENPNGFFVTAVNLVNMINNSAFVKSYIGQHIGKSVFKNDLEKAFDQSFGSSAHTRMALYCNGDALTEIRISLPRSVNNNESISTLIQKVPALGRSMMGNCGSSLYIIKAGQ